MKNCMKHIVMLHCYVHDMKHTKYCIELYLQQFKTLFAFWLEATFCTTSLCADHFLRTGICGGTSDSVVLLCLVTASFLHQKYYVLFYNW